MLSVRAGDCWARRHRAAKAWLIREGRTVLPDRERPRPWFIGVACTGTGATGTWTAEAVPNPPAAGDTRGGASGSVLSVGVVRQHQVAQRWLENNRGDSHTGRQSAGGNRLRHGEERTLFWIPEEQFDALLHAEGRLDAAQPTQCFVNFRVNMSLSLFFLLQQGRERVTRAVEAGANGRFGGFEHQGDLHGGKFLDCGQQQHFAFPGR